MVYTKGQLFFMKNRFFSFIILLLASTSFQKVYCSEKNDQIKFRADINSYYCNQKLEYSIIDNDLHKVNSKLEWESDYLFKLGLGGDLQFKNIDFFCVASFPLPLECGKMYDSDWRTVGIKTNLSKSDLFINSGIDATLGIKYNFEISCSGDLATSNNDFHFYISPVVNITNSFIKLEAKNTIGWCGDRGHTHLDRDYSWDSEYAKKVKKYGIDLTNNITSVFCGVEASAVYNALQAKAGFLISPYTYILSIDHHLNKEEGNFYQLAQTAYFKTLEFYASTGYSINQKNQLVLSADYTFCPTINGDFYYGWFQIENILADETSSFAFSKLSLCLSWQLNI